MAHKAQSDPRKKFTPRILPWLLAAGFFVIYGLTMSHWVTPFNCFSVAKLSGWTWQPEVYNPVLYAVTAPIRWLPAAKIPLALNLFSAICAVVTLGLLARSVALLPQDRTEAQRERERSVFSFFTGRTAWLPPVFAVVVCGLQMTFWEQATNCTPEMFELLLFAFVVWSLLEYRLDEREGRLWLAAVVFGAGMAETWAMVGFLPLFIASLVWIRGFKFFNLSFLSRMFLFGLAGMSFYLLLPIIMAISRDLPVTFWQALKQNLASEFTVVKAFFTQPEVRKTVLLLSPTSFLPLLVMGVRWKSSFGDNSKLGLALTSFMFHLIHAILLVLCVWVAFDPAFSPRRLGLGMPFLTFYYLGALSVGYFTGYFLLVFGRLPQSRSRDRAPDRPRRPGLDPIPAIDRLIFGTVYVFAIVATVGIVYKNLPQIRQANDDSYKNFGMLSAESLPSKGAICLSDDLRRTYLVQAALAQEGRAKDFVMVDTESLYFPSYHNYLHKKFPEKWPDTTSAYEQTNGVSPLHLIGLLAMLSQTNELYYLHPSFGYYFEQFCLEPHGLVYKLNKLPDATLLPPPPDEKLIAENETFWSRASQLAFDPITQAVTPPDPNAPKSLGETLLDRFHVPRERNPSATVIGRYYSRGENFWGVQMQRLNQLKSAAGHFEAATALNPENIVAQINLGFNRSLQAGESVPVDLSKTTVDKFGIYRSWGPMLGDNGPFDEPSFCFEDGLVLANQNGYFRQAVAPLHRVHQLDPLNLPVRLLLARCYLSSHLSDQALDMLRGPMEEPGKFPLAEINAAEVNILAASAYLQKDDYVRGIPLLQTELSRQPTNDLLAATAVQIYLKRGLYTNAMDIIDPRLQTAPEDPTWLLAKGVASIQVEKYDEATAALSHLLSIQSTNNNALFNRAVAYLKSGQLDLAQADYLALQQSATNSFQVAFGLGEIAWQRHETNEAIKNYEIYLANVNTNSAEATNIIERLRSLKR